MYYYLDDGVLYKMQNYSKVYPIGLNIYEDNYNYGINVIDDKNNILPFRFSKISLNTKISFKKENDNIVVIVKAVKNNEEYVVKHFDNKFLDYIIINDSWYYLNGDLLLYKEKIIEYNIANECQLNYQEFMKISRDFNDILEENVSIINSVKEDVEIQEDYGLKANLYEYQKSGFNWLNFMVRNNCGCILADEMGLGKTLQIIATIGYNKGENKHNLIVSPVSLLENWKREINKFYPSLKVLVNYGNSQTYFYKNLLCYDVVVTSYSNVQTNLSMYNMIKWNILVLDEAQNIKNPYAKRTKALKMVNRVQTIAVTGTPFENHMTDIWSIVDFVIPNYLGTISQFEKLFTDDYSSAINVEKYLSPIMIRRKVKDVAKDLPQKVDIPQPILMTDEEARFYEDGRNSIGQVSDLKQTKIQMIQKLRMFCTHPMVYNKEYSFADPCVVSNKYCRLCEILQDIVDKNEKVIVFTSFNEMINIMIKDLKVRFNIYINYINGSIEAIDRQVIVDEFSKVNGPSILILNPKAAGAGLNITAANHVIHYNLDWNPALEDQASARSYRRGQDKVVFIHRLFYVDTIEEIINERIESKRELSEIAVVGNDGDINNEDFVKVLSISPYRKD